MDTTYLNFFRHFSDHSQLKMLFFVTTKFKKIVYFKQLRIVKLTTIRKTHKKIKYLPLYMQNLDQPIVNQ